MLGLPARAGPDRVGAQEVVLDLTRVSHVDDAGLRMLLGGRAGSPSTVTPVSLVDPEQMLPAEQVAEQVRTDVGRPATTR